MNDFEFYLNEGEVKKRTPDPNLAKALLRDAESRFENIVKLDTKTFHKIIFENAYDSFRELLDALLAIDGYKSYSHEASIAYLKKYGFDDSIILELDEFRFKRNSSKYYGKDVSPSDAEGIIKFYRKRSEPVISLIKRRLRENRAR